MTRCAKNHDDLWDINCPQCLTPIDYREACRELLKLPEANINFEETEAIYIGTPKASAPNTFTCQVTTGPEEHAEIDTLTLQEKRGATWRDYLENGETLSQWLKKTSIGRSKHRILTIDTTHPLSILAARNPTIKQDTTIFAITADDASTPMEKNTSYAALKTIHERELPTILATISYVENLTIYNETSGLSMRRQAFNQIITDYLKQIRTTSSFIDRDRRLGIETHTLSTLTSANAQIFRDIETALETQRRLKAAPHDDDDVLSIRLLGAAHWETFNKIEQAYKHLRSRFKNLIDSEISLHEQNTRHRLYTIHIIYGLRNDPILPRIKEGYEVVARRIPSLKMEAYR